MSHDDNNQDLGNSLTDVTLPHAANEVRATLTSLAALMERHPEMVLIFCLKLKWKVKQSAPALMRNSIHFPSKSIIMK